MPSRIVRNLALVGKKEEENKQKHQGYEKCVLWHYANSFFIKCNKNLKIFLNYTLSKLINYTHSKLHLSHRLKQIYPSFIIFHFTVLPYSPIYLRIIYKNTILNIHMYHHKKSQKHSWFFMVIHKCILCSVFRDCKRIYWESKIGKWSEMLGMKGAFVLIRGYI